MRKPAVDAITIDIQRSIFRGAALASGRWRETVMKKVKNPASSRNAESGNVILHSHSVTLASQRRITPVVQNP